jgi:hypothetical protein
LRILASPLAESSDNRTVTFAESWIPCANLAGDDAYVAAESISAFGANYTTFGRICRMA